MRTKSYIAVLLGIMALAVLSCKKDPTVNIETFEIATEELEVGTTMAQIVGAFSYDGKVDDMKVFVSDNEALVHAKSFDVVLDGNAFMVELTDLKVATTYYYYYSVDYGFSKPFNTKAGSFTTLSEVPAVRTVDYVIYDEVNCRVKCEVLSEGGKEVTERGICWNNLGDPTLDDEVLTHSDGGLGIYILRMENLDMGRKYYVRSYAKNATGVGYGEVLDFETSAMSGTSVDIELSCNPEEGGSVSGGGTFEVGTQCTVTAVANQGYTFVNWSENGNQVSSEATYTFVVSTARSLVANYTMQAYVITAEVDPDDSGTVTGAGGYNYGEECTLVAKANTGYDFVKWTKGGTTVSTDSKITFQVTASATYTAHFQIKSYTVSVMANPSEGGTVSGSGTFNYGELRTVHAEPAYGFAFSNWTDDGDVVSTEADYTFKVTSTRTLVANFMVLQVDEYFISISADPAEGGTVSGGGTYKQGQQCKVTATSKPGFTFVNWTENGIQVTELSEYTFTVSQSRTLVANFEAEVPNEYIVSVSANPSTGGTVTGGDTYQQDSQCNVTATANDGYEFVNWTENDNEVSSNANFSFFVNGDRTLVANFTLQVVPPTVTTNQVTNIGETTATGHGDVTADGGAAVTERGVCWSTSHTPTTSGSHASSGTGTGTFSINMTGLTPNTTYYVRAYAKNTAGTSYGDEVSFTTLELPSYTITISADPSNGGNVTGGGTYQQGQSCTVKAFANTGYTFLKWTENGTQVSTKPSYTFPVSGNRTLVANFVAQPQAPVGAINGLFSVSATQHVWFSQGNLQYKASTNTWRFAEHQWDYVGTQTPEWGNPGGTVPQSDNSNISQNYNGWIDLFGWGTSGYNHGANCYQPWSTSTSYADYYVYGSSSYHLFNQTGKADWGYNAIANGGNMENIGWRTLTRTEWVYMIHTRSTPSGIRYAKAKVNNVNGVIFLPDNWDSSYYTLSNTNQYNASFSSNTITASQWNALEQHGAVFLPAAGYRGVSSALSVSVGSVGSAGYYWSASYFSTYNAWNVNFDYGSLYTDNIYSYRYYGHSLRCMVR